ncbi:endolytic transglycosylase MltG [Candidatus Saccharibacteria bacterium]|nr:endolytic transglycosylase MltG [Candidatus Saccharibacteria bacterium]
MKFLGLDVGEKRIGVAKADSSVKIATPHGVVLADDKKFDNIIRLVKMHDIDVVVVGMPRNLKGEFTRQSDYVKDFVKSLNKQLLEAKPNGKTIKIYFQDESLTSVEAKQNLKNRKGGFDKKSGDIDSEAATLILQDFLENLERRVAEKRAGASSAVKPPVPQKPLQKPGDKLVAAQSTPVPEAAKPKQQFRPHGETNLRKWLFIRILIIIAVLGAVAFFSLRAVYNALISPAVKKDDCASIFNSDETDPCRFVEVEIADGSTVSTIASQLEDASLIKSALAFRVYNKLNNTGGDLKAGTYKLTGTMTVEEIVKKLIDGTGEPIVFRFTALPGETLKDIKKRLVAVGYSEEEVDAALNKKYNHPVLADKPEDASLEGYLFGETYEFYLTDTVETIVVRMLDELYSVVEKNQIRQKFNNMGLTLHEGIILASIVQKEAGTLSKEDQKLVASVFLNRLNSGIALGSDVTVKYALDQIDPERKTYSDNASALTVDSCYNTRKNIGLPCGPISNPSALVLISTANPADSSYYYFLTGDDGMMYYSNTEYEHNQNISAHCQELCNVSL